MTKELNLTKGDPTKVILQFAIPFMLSSLFLQLYTSVDQIFMGQYVSVQAMAAIGTTGSMISFFTNVTMGICTGLSIVISQYYGAKNDPKVHACSANSLLISLILSLVMGVSGFILAPTILRWLNTPSDVFEMASLYSRCVLGGLFCNILYNISSGILRGLGNSKVPLFCLIGASVLHIALDFLFILGFHMTVSGVALATVVSQGVAALATFVYMFKHYKVLRFTLKQLRPDSEILKRVFTIGVPIGLQSACFTIGMMVIMRTINSFGTDVVAGYSAGVRVEELSFIFFTAFCHSITNYMGQNAGAKDLARIDKGFRSTLIILLITTSLASLLIYTLGPLTLTMFVQKSELNVLRIAKGFLFVNAAAYLPMGLIMLYNMALKGFGLIKIPMISAAIELFCKVFFAVFLAQHFGYFGIWFAEPIGWILGLIPSLICYHRKKWRKRILSESL